MIKPPGWCKEAKATVRGWESDSGEVLCSRKHTVAQVNEYNIRESSGVVVMEKTSVQSLNEAPSSKSIEDMTKRELSELATHHEIETKSTDSKSSIFNRVKDFLKG